MNAKQSSTFSIVETNNPYRNCTPESPCYKINEIYQRYVFYEFPLEFSNYNGYQCKNINDETNMNYKVYSTYEDAKLSYYKTNKINYNLNNSPSTNFVIDSSYSDEWFNS